MIKILSLLTFFTTVLSHRITSDSIICFESTSSYLSIFLDFRYPHAQLAPTILMGVNNPSQT